MAALAPTMNESHPMVIPTASTHGGGGGHSSRTASPYHRQALVNAAKAKTRERLRPLPRTPQVSPVDEELAEALAAMADDDGDDLK